MTKIHIPAEQWESMPEKDRVSFLVAASQRGQEVVVSVGDEAAYLASINAGVPDVEFPQGRSA